jgi:tetratricopeptide (TPR) repeat protein
VPPVVGRIAGSVDRSLAGNRKTLSDYDMDTEEALHKAGALRQQGGFAEAEILYRDVLRERPESLAALEGLGVILLQHGKVDEAARWFAQGLTVRPDAPRIHLYLGEALRLLKRFDEARHHLRRAVALDPSMPHAWNSLGLLAYDQGRFAAAEVAYREAIRLQPSSTVFFNNQGNSLMALRRWSEAAEALRTALSFDPYNPAALTNLGQVLCEMGDPAALVEAESICQRALAVAPRLPHASESLGNLRRLQGRFDEAISCYESALKHDLRRSMPLLLMGRLLHERGDFAGAARSYRAAAGIEPRHVQAHHGLGLALLEQGRFDAAEACFREALRIDPNLAGTWAGLARLYAERGEFDRSCESARAALAIDPKFPDAYCRLAANLKGRLPESDLQVMQGLLDDEALSDDTRASLHFCLAAVFDARSLYSRAAALVETANSLRASARAARGASYDPDRQSRFIDGMIAAFTPDFLARRRDWGDPDARPVFVVGLPRSGTTLVEQILASHSQVHGAGELPDLRQVFRLLPELVGQPSLHPFRALDMLDPAAARTAARRYLDLINASAPPTAACIVDKMPDNIELLGLIALLWPGARVIVCGRDLRDIAISCRQTDFVAIDWTNAWEDIARRFADYQRIRDHWKRIRPLEWLDIQYEDLVVDLEARARRLVEYVGLEWEPACLEFHATRRVVRTASMHQVRQPIHRHSVGRFRNYESMLVPLLQALERHGVVLNPGG